MVLDAARAAAHGLFAKNARSVVLKSLGLTILLFFGLWFGMQNLATVYLVPFLEGWSWTIAILFWILGAGLVVAAGFLLAPVTAIFAGLFLDEVAENVERHSYPDDPSGNAIPLLPSLWLASKFGLLVLAANIITLLLVWLAGLGLIVFFVVNGYLLGREYFQFAAMRFHDEREANQLRKDHSLDVFLSGLIIALFMSVPVLNLLTPVFAVKMMVHLFKSVSHRQLE